MVVAKPTAQIYEYSIFGMTVLQAFRLEKLEPVVWLPPLYRQGWLMYLVLPALLLICSSKLIVHFFIIFKRIGAVYIMCTM